MSPFKITIASIATLTIVSCAQKEEPKPMPEEMPANHEQMGESHDSMMKDTPRQEEKSEVKASTKTHTKHEEVKSAPAEEKTMKTQETPAPTNEMNVRDTTGSKKVKKLSRPR